MKLSFSALLAALVLCVFSVSAQSMGTGNSNAKKPFPFIAITVKAPDREDSIFVVAAVRDALIRSGRAVKVAEKGDPLFVQLTVEFNGDWNTSGYNGKSGEMSLAINSKSGKASGTATGEYWSENSKGWFGTIRELAEKAAKNFEYFEWKQ